MPHGCLCLSNLDWTAFFTFLLVIVTGGLWLSSFRQQRDLARQFIALNSPSIMVTGEVLGAAITSNAPVFKFNMENKGKTAAKALEVEVSVHTQVHGGLPILNQPSFRQGIGDFEVEDKQGVAVVVKDCSLDDIYD